MIKRESGIDLLRCVALLFVNGVHGFLYNTFYYQPQTGVLMWGADSARWLFYSCNCLFMLLTGYLKSGKPFKKGYYRSLFVILIGYFLTCAISFPIRHFFLNEKLSLYEWAEKLVTFGNYGWYVEMYIGLFLLAPFLNIILEKLESPRQYLWFLGTMLFLTALPSVTSINLIPDYWTSLYPLTLYVVGAGIRRYRPNVPGWLAALLTVATVCLLGLFSILSTDKRFSDGFTQGYGAFWVTLTGTLVFLALYRVQLPGKLAGCVRWMAGGCFEGYLLSRLFDVWAYSYMPFSWRQPDKYWLLFLVVTIPIFIVSILMGKVTHAIAERLGRLLLPKKKETPVQ
jgi:surface polysaccharide O-acyltransferase-like enzyme